MKTTLKFIVGAGALTLAMSMTGCGNDNKTTQANPEPATPTESNNLPIIKVVTDGESPPMTFVDEHGTPQGIDIDVIRAIGESQGFKVEIHRDVFSNIFSDLDSGKYQVAISSLSLTEERASKYGHTDTYLHNPAIIMHNQGNLNDISGLKHLRVATTNGTIYTPIAQEIKPAEHRINNTNFQNFQGLLQGTFDATLGDKYVLEYMLARYPNKPLNSFEYKIGDGSSANMVIYTKKDNQELIDKLNKGISELKQAGKIDSIIQSYLANS